MQKIKKFEPLFLGFAVLAFCSWIASATLFELVGVSSTEARPWSIYQYLQFSNLKEFWMAVAAGVAPALFLGLVLVIPKKETIYGDARWAKESEVAKAGFRAKQGILYGKFKGKYLISNEPLHSVICAPTRSGKGVGIIIPGLLSWDGSAIVYDLKFENFEITSGYRASHGHQVFLWAPMSPTGQTHAYNPLDLIRDDQRFRITDAQSLSSYLIPLSPKEPIWDQLAQQFFTGLVLYVLDKRAQDEASPATIGEIYRILNSQPDLQQWALEAAAEPWVDANCRRLLTSYAGMSEKERSFARTSIIKIVNLWANPLVDAATSRSDFDLRKLRKNRMTIYIGVSNDTRGVLAPLIALFFQQALAEIIREMPKKDEPHKVFFCMDEFASLGRMPIIANAVTMAAGYGARLMFILQALSTLDEFYGKEGREVILQNCAIQVYYAASDEVTSRYVVNRLGKKTVKTKSKTTNKGSVSTSVGESARDLMLYQEFQGLDRSRAVILVESSRPIFSEKIRYYEDSVFMARLLAPVKVPEIKIGDIPAIPKKNDQISAITNAFQTLLTIDDPSIKSEQEELQALLKSLNEGSSEDETVEDLEKAAQDMTIG